MRVRKLPTNSSTIWRLPTALLLVAMPASIVVAQAGDDWPYAGGDAGSTRFSRLMEINPNNVSKLTIAWSYDMRPADIPKATPEQFRHEAQQRWRSQGLVKSGPPLPPAWASDTPVAPSSGSQFTPLVVDGVMYFGSPFGRVVALDASSGREKWVLQLPQYEQTSPRGLAYWPGDKNHAARLVVTLRSNKVLTIDPATGGINSRFGEDGILDLRTPEIMGRFPRGVLGANGLPVLYQNLMILGSRGQEFPRNGPRGDVRAFDIVSGKLVWSFNAIPEPGEPNFGTWEKDSWKDRAGVNVWNSPTVDEQRGIVYLGFGTPAYDRDGTERGGAGLYGTSLVAVDARTGKYLWHFQTVHHDIWDVDMPVVPTLMTVTLRGKSIPVVTAMTKTSLLFILDRVTGKPIHEINEVPVPPSEVPGEKAWPTQPIPVRPEPLSRTKIDLPREIAQLTPEHTANCQKMVDDLHLRGAKLFEPIGFNKATLQFPGIFGGVDWWGGAFDRTNGYYIINTMSLGTIGSLRLSPQGQVESGTTSTYWFSDMSGERYMPCQAPPWGELMAVDISAGKIVWRRPLGVTDSLPEGKRETGRPMMGGPIATASGLVFVAATDDQRFRAFGTKTGKLLWEAKLDAAGHSTPLTYRGKDGRQFVALIATGGTLLNTPSTSDKLVAFALPLPGSPVSTIVNTSSLTRPDTPGSLSGSAQKVTSQDESLAAKTIMGEACLGCHDMTMLTRRPIATSEWASILGRMAGLGAKISQADRELLERYLTKTYSTPPPNAPPGDRVVRTIRN